MSKYDKYIDMEFYYEGEYLNYEGCDKSAGGVHCNRCGRPIKKNEKEHIFTLKDGRENASGWESRFFGSKCMAHIVGAGFGK